MMWDWQCAFQSLPEILRGLRITLVAVAAGTIIALILGLVWAVARRSPRRIVAWPSLGLVEFIRSTPLLVQIYFLFYVLPRFGLTLSPLTTGILALGLHYSCYMSEVYRAGINSVNRGQWEACRALNLSRWQTWRHVVLPQAIPPIVPALGNYLIAMFKDTPLLSAITVLEMLERAKIIGNTSFRYLEPLTVVGLIFLALSLLSGVGIKWLEQHLKAAGS